jgi:hypothetical protein
VAARFCCGIPPKANIVVLCRYAPWKKIQSTIKGPIVGAVGRCATQTIIRAAVPPTARHSTNVRFGSISTEIRCPHHVRFPPDNDQIADITIDQRRATRRHSGGQQFHATSSFIAPTILTASGSARPRTMTSRRGKLFISTPAVVATISDTMS